MSNRKQQTGEGYDRPRSPEWYAEVHAEAQAALAHIKIRDAAARAQRAEIKASQQRNNAPSGNGT